MTTSDGNWLLLVNPAAGGGRAGRLVGRVSETLCLNDIPHRTIVTTSAGHLASLAGDASGMGMSGVAILGGDGSASHAASGMLKSGSALPLAVIPAGNGNDWVRSLGTGNLRSVVDAMTCGRTATVDAGRCSVSPHAGEPSRETLFVNSAGIGLDAHVLMRSLELRRRVPFGKAAYLCSLVSTVVTMPMWEADVTVDGSTVYQGKYLSLTIGVCPYVGGGMMLSPSARPDDGVLDGAMVGPINRRRLVTSLPQVYRGSLLSNPAVSTWRGKCFLVRSEKTLRLELDGEPVADITGECHVKIESLPGVLEVVVGPDYPWGLDSSTVSSSGESAITEAP